MEEKKENIFNILEELVAEVKSRQWDTEEDVWGAEAKLIDEYSEKIELKLSEAREEGARDVFTKEEWFTMEELAYLEEVMHLDYSLAVTFGQREKSDIGGGLLRKLDKLNKKK